VLYIRNLAEQTSETDVARYCMCFGSIPHILLFPEKRHGFVQFDSVEAATACLNFYSEHALAPHGTKMEFAFSGRDEITHKRDPDLNAPNKILIVTVSQVVYPVTVDVMQQIMTPFTDGRGMKRCVIFNRQEAIQALVELWSLEDAVAVKGSLDGLNIYPGCNALKVQFSSMTELHVRANNAKSFDFSAPGAGTRTQAKAKAPAGQAGSAWQVPQEAPAQDRRARRKELPAQSGVPVLVVSGLNTARTKAEDLAALFAVYGNVIRVQLLWAKRRGRRESWDGPGVALVHMQDATQCQLAQMNLSNMPLHDALLCIEPAPIGGYPLPDSPGKKREELMQTREFKDLPTYNRHKGGSEKVAKLYPPGPALHVSNMPDNTSGEKVLAILQSAGAQIRNFKFIDNLHHIAVVLCASLENAVEVITRAHNVPIGTPSRPIRVGFGAFRA